MVKIEIKYSNLMEAFNTMLDKHDRYLTKAQVNERWQTFINEVRKTALIDKSESVYLEGPRNQMGQ